MNTFQGIKDTMVAKRRLFFIIYSFLHITQILSLLPPTFPSEVNFISLQAQMFFTREMLLAGSLQRWDTYYPFVFLPGSISLEG